MPTALVTGATAGIGLEFARQLAARGHDLVLVARDTERLESVASDLQATYGVGAEVLTADLTDRAQLALVEERVASPDRPVELLVNNAGFGLKRRFLDNDVDQEQAMLDVLVVAVMRLSHAALGAMTARGSGGIINVSSVAAFLPRGTYSAAKAYVNSFGAWAANEYRPRGVTVTTLVPRLHQDRVPRADGGPPRLGLPLARGRLPGLGVPGRLRQGQGACRSPAASTRPSPPPPGWSPPASPSASRTWAGSRPH